MAATLAAEARGPAVSPPSSVISSSFAVFFFLSLSFLFLSSFLFFLFSSLFHVLSLSRSFGLSLLFCSRSPFFFPFPCFYKQKQGRETWMGRPLCCRPSTVRPTRGKWLVSRCLFKGWMAVTEEGKKISFFLLSLLCFFFFLPLPLLCSSLVLFFDLSLPSLPGPFFFLPLPLFL